MEVFGGLICEAGGKMMWERGKYLTRRRRNPIFLSNFCFSFAVFGRRLYGKKVLHVFARAVCFNPHRRGLGLYDVMVEAECEHE